MNTTQCNRLDRLLNFGIPKKDQKPRAYLGNVEYINMDRTLMVRTSDGVEDAPIYAFMAHEETDTLNTKVFDMANGYNMSAYSRKELIAILEGMDSDWNAILLSSSRDVRESARSRSRSSSLRGSTTGRSTSMSTESGVCPRCGSP